MDRLDQIRNHKEGNYIYPFLWMHGEPHNILIRELDRIRKANIGAVCIEARPHPDFGGKKWWEDMDVVMNYTRSHGMKVWLLDDDRFPTGHANGIFREGNHELANEFLTVWCTDTIGPLANGSMLIQPILRPDSRLVRVTACKRSSGDNTDIEPEIWMDLTGQVKNGWLRFDVPDGLWRIMVFYTTHQGDGKLDYFNIINSRSVKLLIDRVYQPHFERYGDDFGKTFTGFFSDEPEFANLAGYDFQARLGKDMKFIPWSEELETRLIDRWGEHFARNLPAMWYRCGDITGHVRYEYMDEVTTQLKISFSDQIGQWCKDHGVMHVGHIIEDDNSHGRLGCSTGHYFRSLSQMGMSGIDVVLLQVMPGMYQTVHQWVASDRDGEFFHYGLGKMGSSLAHIDEKKKGNAMCEIFGAFGWQEGITLMKWLADHMLSRGINHFVPHAFSPKNFPDADCPPHFYAGGRQPQYVYFGDLMKYMNRLSHLFSEGRYVSQAAVLYHADAEWAGEAMLFQKPVRKLLENQIDCDIISADELFNHHIIANDRSFKIGPQSYQVLVIPYSQYLPAKAVDTVKSLLKAEIPVYFIDGLPEGICEEADLDIRPRLLGAEVVSLYNLASAIEEKTGFSVHTDVNLPDLRTYRYQYDRGTALYCFNESTGETINSEIKINIETSQIQYCYRYHAYDNQLYRIPFKQMDGIINTRLQLEPGEAAVYIIKEEKENLPYYVPYEQSGRKLGGEWKLSYADIGDDTDFKELYDGDQVFQDLTDWAAEKKFNGYLRYETEMYLNQDKRECLRISNAVNGMEIFVNGIVSGRKIGPPYYQELLLKKGKNHICIEIGTTPVYAAGDDWSALTVLPPLGLIKEPEFCDPLWE